jgi:hypothetical protein
LRKRLGVVFRVFLAVAALALTAVQSVIVTGVRHWSPWIAVGAAVGVGGLTFIDQIRQISARYQSAQRNAARTTMQQELITLMYLITEDKTVKLIDLGASVFNIRRYWTLRPAFIPIPWLPWREQRLHRILRFRLSASPQTSQLSWTKGKGAIGKCWEERQPVLLDRRATIAQFGEGKHPTDDAAFSRLTTDQRAGFSREEFNQMIDRYGEILAVPVVAKYSGEFLGVLSIDCRAEAYPKPDSPSVLAGHEIEEFAIRATQYIVDDVSRF